MICHVNDASSHIRAAKLRGSSGLLMRSHLFSIGESTYYITMIQWGLGTIVLLRVCIEKKAVIDSIAGHRVNSIKDERPCVYQTK